MVGAFKALALVAALGQIQVDSAEVLRYGDRVQHIDGQSYGSSQVSAAAMEVMGPPASDADKWFITVLTMKGCAACEKLKADWASSPQLQSLAVPGDPARSWAHFTSYDREQVNQAWRGYAAKVQYFPHIVVQPPRTGKYGDATNKVYDGPYRGDPVQLYQEISAAIVGYVNAQQPYQPGPYQPGPAPVNPYVTPAPYVPGPVNPFNPPNVMPFVQPNVTPVAPLVQPNVAPLVQPVTPAPVAPAVNTDTYPQVIAVIDTQGLLDQARRMAVEQVAQIMQDHFGGNAKARIVSFEEAKAMGLPVNREDTPAIFLMVGGKIRAYVTAQMVESLLPGLATSPWFRYGLGAVFVLVALGVPVGLVLLRRRAVLSMASQLATVQSVAAELKKADAQA